MTPYVQGEQPRFKALARNRVETAHTRQFCLLLFCRGSSCWERQKVHERPQFSLPSSLPHRQPDPQWGLCGGPGGPIRDTAWKKPSLRGLPGRSWARAGTHLGFDGLFLSCRSGIKAEFKLVRGPGDSVSGCWVLLGICKVVLGQPLKENGTNIDSTQT